MMPTQMSAAATAVAPPGGAPARLATNLSQNPAATPARAVKVPAPAMPKANAAQLDANDIDFLQQAAVRAPRVPPSSSTAVLKSLTQPEEEVINDIRGFCAPGSPVENQLRLFVEGFLEYQRSCGYSSSHRERSNKLLAQELSSKGYQVALRHHSSQSNSTGVSPNVRDTYIVFSGVPGHATEDYVIELDFRDRFNIANPTPFYNTCLAAVPEVWVGPLEQLLPLVELVCYEMCIAFEDRNLEMPPWRSHSKVASRWLSSQVRSFSVESVNPMAHSPTNTPPRGSQISESSMSCVSGQSADNTGLTLTPLQISQRSCSLNFEKVEVAPPSPVKETSNLKKATSLLAMHILTASSPRSPKSSLSPAIA